MQQIFKKQKRKCLVEAHNIWDKNPRYPNLNEVEEVQIENSFRILSGEGEIESDVYAAFADEANDARLKHICGVAAICGKIEAKLLATLKSEKASDLDPGRVRNSTQNKFNHWLKKAKELCQKEQDAEDFKVKVRVAEAKARVAAEAAKLRESKTETKY